MRGKQKTVGTRTLGGLWKEEGWCRVHRVNKMDTTGTFRNESREYEGGEFEVD